MKKIFKHLLVILFLVSISQAYAQSFKFGISTSANLTWISTNDITIKSLAPMTGVTMGLQADYMFKPQWVLEAGTAFFLNQGGKLSYNTGGNFWPASELKIPKYNHGPKPIADGSVLQYNMKLWSISLGLKKMFNRRQEARTFVELPTLYFSEVVKARGALYNQKMLTDNENIIQDLHRFQFGLGTGVGIEKNISKNAAVYLTAQYIQYLTDLTKNGGFKSNFISLGNTSDPADDIYEQYPEHSRALLHGLSLKIGLLF